jgi:DNA repair protein RadC
MPQANLVDPSGHGRITRSDWIGGTEAAQGKAKVGTVHYHGHRQRLRERFLKSGLESFADYEAVELLLTLAVPRKDVKVAAKLAIERFGSFRGVLDAPLEELRKIPGLGDVAPAALRIIREAANRYLQQKSQETFSLASQEVLFDYCRSALGALPHEVFKVIYLEGARPVRRKSGAAGGRCGRLGGRGHEADRS